METKAQRGAEICSSCTTTVICEVHARIPVNPLMFHISDSHYNESNMNQYSPIIILVEFKISPYQTLICA